MSADSISTNLSDFFNNDDSQGQLLAKFLQERRGVGQKPNYVFMNCEMQNMSIEVQFEKILPSQLDQTYQNKSKQLENEKVNDAGDVTLKLPDIQSENPSQLDQTYQNKSKQLENEKVNDAGDVTLKLPDIQSENQEDNADEILSLNSKDGCNFLITGGQNETGLQFQPISPVSPAINRIADITVSPSQSSSSLKPVSSRQIRCSSIRKSGGGISHGDRLRRYSLKQSSKHYGGRRILLKEFESAIENRDFQPPSYSTPLSKPQPNSPSKNNSVNGSCCNHTDTLVRTLQKKDDELKKYMEGLLENTLKQIQNQEKENSECKTNKENTINSCATNLSLNRINGNDKIDCDNLSPNGRAPEQCLSHASLIKLRNNLRPSPNKLMKSQRNYSFQNLGSVHRFNKSLTHIGSRSNPSKSLTKNTRCRSVGHLKQETPVPILKNAALEVQYTSPQKNVTIVLSSQNNEIPATENLKENCISKISGEPDTLVFVPVNQTFNNICHAEAVNNKSAVKETTKQSEIQLPSLPPQVVTSTTNDVQYNEMSEDNLKLSDILTDDEDLIPEASASRIGKSKVELPLNLASSFKNLRSRCLPNCSTSVQRSQIANCNLISTEIDTLPFAQVNNSRRMTKRKKLTLNRAPGTPINGEIFAQELKRMSYYEILDLRRRNSIGRVFGISGRKSRRFRNEAIEKQHKLDEEIGRELLSRNKSEIIEKQPTQCNHANVNVENLLEIGTIPVEHEVLNITKESSLIDENSSFKTTKPRVRLSKPNKKQESTSQYLEVSENLSQNKIRTSFNQSKLKINTTKDLDTRPSLETVNSFTTHRVSPPTSDGNLVTILEVVSVPPTIQQPQLAINEVETSAHETPLDVVDNEYLPPPPPGFENSLEAIVNNHSTTNNTYKSCNHINTNNNADSDEQQIFKKPQQPAPKRGRRRKKDSKQLNDILQLANESQRSAYNSDASTENTVRRSKRGHVPLKFSISTFQLLFEKTLNKNLQRNKQKERMNLKVSTISSKNNPAKDTKAGRKPKQPLNAEKNHPLITSSPQNVASMTKKVKNKVKESKSIRKKNKNNKEIAQSEDNLDCTRLTTPPHVDYLNNAFDQLRHGMSTIRTQSQTTSLPPQKVKPLKVRVARLKTSAQPIGCNSVSTTASSINSSRQDFISWLKNSNESNLPIAQNNQFFKEMRLSRACNLSFTELQGVEYGFYDADEKASLGYLRFQPHQKKPKRRSKYFNLHFISLVGDFRITANDKDHRIAVGDMLVIQKLVYYDVENLTDDIGVLMVIKR